MPFHSSNDKLQTGKIFCEKKNNNSFQYKIDDDCISKFENTVDMTNEKKLKTVLDSGIEFNSEVDKREMIEKNGQIHDTPDRASLFSEYCFLSGMFFDAGGWIGLEMKDNLFETGVGPDRNNSSSCNPDDIENYRRYDHQHQNNLPSSTSTLTSVLKSSSVSTSTPKQSSIPIPTSSNMLMQSRGEEKQIETARQHLFWMLEKKGHGRTVRFVHLGDYKRHTDLLTDVKNSNSLIQLNLIARRCLTNIFGSNVYVNDNYS